MSGPPTSPDEQRRHRRARWRGVGFLVFIALSLSVYAWWSAIAAYPMTQAGDGRYYYKVLEAAKWSVLRYHEFPSWNPYECGGVPLWDNPQSFVGDPIAWLTFLIGTTRTMLVWYVLHSTFGFLSMWVFLRLDFKLSRLACFIGSAMWAWNGFHQQHYGNGHFTFVPFLYVPLAFFLWRRAERDDRYAVGMGLLVAWMMYEGGVYPLPHLAVLLAVESLCRGWPPRRFAWMARAALIVLVVGLMVGACRFIPVIHQLRSHTRPIHPDVGHITWKTFRAMFLSLDHDRNVPGEPWKWHEYGSYIGPFLLTLAVVGLLVGAVEHAWLVLVFSVCFILMLGKFTSWAPWAFLNQHVFLFKEMRVPSRFRGELLFTLAAFAAVGIDRLPELLRRFQSAWLRPGQVRGVLVVLGLLGIGDMWSSGSLLFARTFTNRPLATVIVSSRHLYLGGPKLAGFLEQPTQNRGRVNMCWDEWAFEKGAPLWEGDVPQVKLIDSGAGVIHVSKRTQNTFVFEVEAQVPTRVVLNSTYDGGWQTTVGTTANDHHLLAIDVPQGVSHVRVAYRPYGLVPGLVLSGLSFPLVGLYFVWDARRRRARLAGKPGPAGPLPETSSPPSRGSGSVPTTEVAPATEKSDARRDDASPPSTPPT